MSPIPLDASGFENEDDAHAGDRPLPGQYHVRVIAVDDSMEKYDKIIVEFAVLAGTVPGQEDKKQTEYFATSDKATPRLMLLALATGLIKVGEQKAIYFSSETGTPQWMDILGRELVIALDKKEGQDGKEYVNITWDGLWSLSNPSVADVPRFGTDAVLSAIGVDEEQSPPSPSQPAEPAGGETEAAEGGADWINDI